MGLFKSRRRATNFITGHPIQLRFYRTYLFIFAFFIIHFYLLLNFIFKNVLYDIVFEQSPELAAPVMEKFNLLVLQFSAGLVAVCGVALFLVVRHAHRFLGPLVPISRHLTAANAGQSTPRINLRKNDELKDVAEGINQLTGRLGLLTEKGMSLIEVMMTMAVMSIVAVGFITFQSNTYRALRSIDQSQEAQGLVQGVLLGLGTPKAIGPMLNNPTLKQPWTTVPVQKLELNGVVLADVAQPTGRLQAKLIQLVNLNPGGVPFDVRVPVTVGPSTVVTDMHRYMVRLDVDYEKISGDGPSQGGSRMQKKQFFLTVTVYTDGRFYSGYGGETKALFEEMCVGEMGGDYDENKSPRCLITRLGISGSFTDRDDRAAGKDPVVNKGAFNEPSGLYSAGAVSAKVFYPSFGDFGTVAGVTTARSWIGQCPVLNSGCDFKIDLNTNYLHIGGFANADFPKTHNGTGVLATTSPRVVALVDHVVLPSPGSRLGIGLNGTKPEGVLHARHLTGDAPLIENLGNQAALFIRGAGGPAANGTYSALYLTSVATPNDGWVMAYRKAAANNLGMSLGYLNPGYNPLFHFTTTGKMGIGVVAPTEALEVSGNVRVTGTINATGTITSSDARLKKDVRPLEDLMEKIMRLRPVRYVWRDEALGGGEHLGFIAQDMEKVFPEIVHTSADGSKGIAYGELTAVSIQAIQKLNRQIAILEQRVSELESQTRNR